MQYISKPCSFNSSHIEVELRVIWMTVHTEEGLGIGSAVVQEEGLGIDPAVGQEEGLGIDPVVGGAGLVLTQLLFRRRDLVLTRELTMTPVQCL